MVRERYSPEGADSWSENGTVPKEQTRGQRMVQSRRSRLMVIEWYSPVVEDSWSENGTDP